jgi:hypothetical protein
MWQAFFFPDFKLELLRFNQRDTGTILDQTLMHADIGTGYWIYQNPGAAFLTGLAGMLEIHYTSTLEDAETFVGTAVEVLENPPGDFGQQTKPGFPDEPAPAIGNIANRVDLLSLTAGVQANLGQSTNVMVGVAVPLHDSPDRTFDAEVAVYFNYLK